MVLHVVQEIVRYGRVQQRRPHCRPRWGCRLKLS